MSDPMGTIGLNEEELQVLENLIDKRGIEQVLLSISSICCLKAEHIAVNWQDARLAKRWVTIDAALRPTIRKAIGL